MFEDLPVVGTLRHCVETADGWQGVDEAGTTVQVAFPPGIAGVARIPPEGRIVKVLDGRAVGVLLLKRQRSKSRR